MDTLKAKHSQGSHTRYFIDKTAGPLLFLAVVAPPKD